VRQRDEEFDARGGIEAGKLSSLLAGTIDEAAAVIAAVAPERLLEKVTIQGYEVTVLECIYHVVEHFSGHTGQIIFATKALTSEDLGFYGHLRSMHSEKTP
jgi:uncharacterized damage-inducible protein DinB